MYWKWCLGKKAHFRATQSLELENECLHKVQGFTAVIDRFMIFCWVSAHVLDEHS